MKTEELKHLIEELRDWKPHDMEPHLKVAQSKRLLKESGKAIEFLTGPQKIDWDYEPKIIAKETVVSQWAEVVDMKFRLEQLSERVTTLDNARYEQTRSCRDDMLKETSSLWNAVVVTGIILVITALVLVYHISTVKS